MSTQRTLISLFISFLFLGFTQPSTTQSLGTLRSGVVLDAESHEIVPFATIINRTKSTGTVADDHGVFSLRLHSTTQIEVSAIGYKTEKLELSPLHTTVVVVHLTRQNFKLEDINVIGTASTGESEGTRIDRMAMDHLQSSSFSDLLELLPGNSQKDPELTSASYISMRQSAGTEDYNTSLGTAFVIDGMQRSTDATIQSVYGVSYDSDKTNKGMDMRNIETDRIASVEVIDGIASAEYGDLTSGVVIINRKKGVEPLTARLKSDPNSKLGAINYGALLGDKAGALNMGASYLYFTSDPRTSLSEYSRLNLSANYVNAWSGSRLNYNTETSFDFTQSLDSYKNDPEIMYGSDDYIKASYQSLYVSHLGTFDFSEGVVDQISYTLGGGYTKDFMEQQDLVSTNANAIPTNNEEGSKEAIYLPFEYDSYLEVDSRPISLNAKVNASLNFPVWKLEHQAKLGMEFTYDKNIGDGELYDQAYPPFVPSAGTELSTRPRPYNEIPASQKLALYAQDKFSLPLGNVTWNHQIGFRGTKLLGLTEQYTMANKWYFEPRWNSRIHFPSFKISEQEAQLSLHLGAGTGLKFPTLSQLYPADYYFDYKQLDYWSQNEELTTAYIDTRIEDPTNFGLTPYKNKKIEFGPSLQVGRGQFSVTAFYEKMNNGFMNQKQVIQHQYRDYDESSVDPTTIDTKPELEDFTSEIDSVNALYSQVKNGKEVIKKGITYNLSLGKIDALKTKISLNGAYFHTYYSDTLTSYTRPDRYIENEPYQIVGVYTDKNGTTEQQFNTNIKLDTHIPTLGLLFTTNVQMTWFTKSKTEKVSGRPSSYILPTGEQRPFLPGDEEDDLLQYLVTDYTEYYFMTETVPFGLTVNLRATKEIGEYLRFSFVINRLLGYMPDYTSVRGTTMSRTVATPSFGAELKMRF